MSRVVKVLHKSFLPGAGFTTGGEALSPQDVGLTTLDHIDIKHREELMSSDPGGARRQILYSYAAQQFYVIKETTGGEFIEEAATADPVLSFEAFGDSASDVELT